MARSLTLEADSVNRIYFLRRNMEKGSLYHIRTAKVKIRLRIRVVSLEIALFVDILFGIQTFFLL